MTMYYFMWESYLIIGEAGKISAFFALDFFFLYKIK